MDSTNTAQNEQVNNIPNQISPINTNELSKNTQNSEINKNKKSNKRKLFFGGVTLLLVLVIIGIVTAYDQYNQEMMEEMETAAIVVTPTPSVTPNTTPTLTPTPTPESIIAETDPSQLIAETQPDPFLNINIDPSSPEYALFQELQAQGLIAYWTFDQTSDPNFAQDLKNQNNLNIIGATRRQGFKGNALFFDGQTQDYAEIPDAQLVEGFPAKGDFTGRDFTIAGYVKLEGETAGRRPIITKQGRGKRGFMISLNQKNDLTLEVFKDSRNKSEIKPTGGAFGGGVLTNFNEEEWNKFVVSYDFVSDGRSKARLYMNDTLIASSDAVVGPIISNNTPFELGRFFWAEFFSEYFTGGLDEIKIFNTALTEEQILAL